MAKRIYLVTGDRDWGWTEREGAPPLYSLRHERRMKAVFQRLVPGSVLLHGGARGADTMAGTLAPAFSLFGMSMPYARFLGKGGGPARNRKMLAVMVGLREAGWATKVLAFHDDLAQSKGTLDMVGIALDASFSVAHISLVSAKTLRTSTDLRKRLKERA